MSDIHLAREFVREFQGLDDAQKQILRDLLNSGSIIPAAVIGSAREDLLEMIISNQQRGDKEQ